MLLCYQQQYVSFTVMDEPLTHMLRTTCGLNNFDR